MRALNFDAAFAEFWKAYPRKEAKGAARKAFAKRKPDRALLDRILAAIDQQQSGDQWQRGFVPHPATWLNQERWLDEPLVARSHRHELPRETDIDAINAAALARLGVHP
ncbi:MAG TPA: hypothetical protein VM687_11135 [Stenotrophomonas sp.]|nr:hypothetical protein [Stenotrophomonas sp.]